MSLQYCIQCTDRLSGKVGNFVFPTSKPFEAISPVFDNLAELYTWIHEQGYRTHDGGFAVTAR